MILRNGLLVSRLATVFWLFLGQGMAQAVESFATAPANPTGRPMRLEYVRLDDELDEKKPLAAFDPAGFALNSGMLIGQVAQGWVGGMAMGSRRWQWWYDARSTLTAPVGSFGSSVVMTFRDGKIAKLDAVTGRKHWEANLTAFTERPLLLAGTTLFAVSAAQVLHAIDYQSGKVLWLFDGGYPDGLTVRPGVRPVLSDGRVIFGLASGDLVGVYADTGKIAWRFNPQYNDSRFHDYVGEMIVRRGHLIAARYDGVLMSVDLEGGAKRLDWMEQLPSITAATFRGDRLFVGTLAGDVYAFDLGHPTATGAPRHLWRAMTGAAVTTMTAGETDVFVTGAGGRVSALIQRTGATRWVDLLGSSIAAQPLVTDNTLYVSTGQKALYSFRID